MVHFDERIAQLVHARAKIGDGNGALPDAHEYHGAVIGHEHHRAITGDRVAAGRAER